MAQIIDLETLLVNKTIVLVLVSATIAACGAFVPVVQLDKLPLDVRNKAASIRIVGQGQASSFKYQVLTVVEGNSCQNLLTDPPATRAAAIDQVKYLAYETGADAIANLQCAGREGTSTHTNCWELISCTAEAIKLE